MSLYMKNICCFCLSVSTEHLNSISTKCTDNLTAFEKINTTLLDLSNVMDSESAICTKCSETIDFIYTFNKNCLNNIKILSSYKKLLKENGTKEQFDLHVDLSKFKQTSSDFEIGSNDIKIEPVKYLCNNYEKQKIDFFLEKDTNEVLTIKEEKPDYDNNEETFEKFTALPDSKTGIKIEEINVKMECSFETNNGLEYEPKELITEDINQFSTEDLQIKKETTQAIDYQFLKVEKSLNKPAYNKSNTKSKSSEEKYPFKCLLCYKTFQYEMKLENHKLIHSTEKTYCCDQCDKRYADKVKLNEHKKIHSAENPYKCIECGKKFLTESHLEQHLPVHSPAKPFKCDICKHTFRSKTHLNEHMIVHTNERSYKCSTCDKSFKHKRSLDIHQFTHGGVAPHTCDICGKGFTEKAKLNRHKRYHTGEKPHKCEFCGKAFSDRQNLIIHTRIHTKEIPFFCNICTKPFPRKSTLERHKIRVHTLEK